MGQAADPYAVVDSSGKVFGVSGLRVADASVFPLLPPGHPQATVCEYTSRILHWQATSSIDLLLTYYSILTDMLAEKLADDIKNKR